MLILQKYINSKQKILRWKISLCFGNISGGFLANNMKKKTVLNGCLRDFSADYRAFGTSNIVDIHKYLMKKNKVKNISVN